MQPGVKELRSLADLPELVLMRYLDAYGIADELLRATDPFERAWLTVRLDRADDFRQQFTFEEYEFVMNAAVA